MGGNHSVIDANKKIRRNEEWINQLMENVDKRINNIDRYDEEESDKHYYRKEKVNSFFTGKDETPSVNTQTGENNTYFYTKDYINEVVTGDKSQDLPTGPIIQKRDLGGYYTKEEADNVFSKNSVDNYYNENHYRSRYVEIEKSDRDAVYDVGKEVVVTIRNSSKNGNQCGKFSLITDNSTKRRTFFGYVSDKNFIKNMLTNPMHIRIFKDGVAFNKDKTFYADVSAEISEYQFSMGVLFGHRIHPELQIIELDSNQIKVELIKFLHFIPLIIDKIFIRVSGFAP